jgi:hypothetical protein
MVGSNPAPSDEERQGMSDSHSSGFCKPINGQPSNFYEVTKKLDGGNFFLLDLVNDEAAREAARIYAEELSGGSYEEALRSKILSTIEEIQVEINRKETIEDLSSRLSRLSKEDRKAVISRSSHD